MQFIDIIYAVSSIVFGLVFGSFLNVCIYRIPRGETIVFGRSHCMTCGETIKSRDLIPVFSYLWLRGKCRNCGAKISPQYPIVELLNAILWFCAYKMFGASFMTLAAMAFISGLIVTAFIDINTKLVSNKLVLYLFIVGVISCFIDSLPWYEKLLGIAACGGPLLIILIASRGGMGGGDVKFAAAAGLFLGWRLGFLSLFFSFIIGAVFGLIYMCVTKCGRKAQIPFAPFLAAGMLVALFFGNTLIDFYVTALNL